MLEVVDVPSRPFRSITARMCFASALPSLAGLPLLGFFLGRTRTKNLPVSQVPAPASPIRLSPLAVRCDSNSASHKNSLFSIWLLFSPSEEVVIPHLLSGCSLCGKPIRSYPPSKKSYRLPSTRTPCSRCVSVAMPSGHHHITTVVDDLAKMYARP